MKLAEIMKLSEIKRKAHGLEDQHRRKLNQLQDLQGRCHHPRLKEKGGNTVCAVCTELVFFGKKVLSEKELTDLNRQVGGVQKELDELEAQFAELRKHCPHPEDTVIHSEDSWCGICLENWWDIQKKKETASVVT